MFWLRCCRLKAWPNLNCINVHWLVVCVNLPDSSAPSFSSLSWMSATIFKFLNMFKWSPHQFSFTKQWHCVSNINATKSFPFLSLTFKDSLFVLISTIEYHSLIVSRKALFQLYKPLKCPQARQQISTLCFSFDDHVLWLQCGGDKKKRISLWGATIYAFYLRHQLHPFIHICLN